MPRTTPDPLPVDPATFRQIVFDVACSRLAVGVLSELLQQSDFGTDGTGLSVLLEGTGARLDLAMDGLQGAALALGITDVHCPRPVPG